MLLFIANSLLLFCCVLLLCFTSIFAFITIQLYFVFDFNKSFFRYFNNFYLLTVSTNFYRIVFWSRYDFMNHIICILYVGRQLFRTFITVYVIVYHHRDTMYNRLNVKQQTLFKLAARTVLT